MARRPEKNDGAFRTIREVADWLGVPTHVLRFWESKFDQVAPVKGAGGRRYYRPEDMKLLGGIKVLLHDQGQTIRGVVQKIDDEGVEPVCALAPELEAPEPAGRTRRVIRKDDAPVPDVAPPEPEVVEPDVETPTPEPVEDAVVFEPSDQPVDAPAEQELGAPADTPAPVDEPELEPELEPEPVADMAPVVEPETVLVAKAEPLDPSTPLPPSAAALALVRGATGCNDPRRLRRVTRRLRGLAAEIADDLAG